MISNQIQLYALFVILNMGNQEFVTLRNGESMKKLLEQQETPLVSIIVPVYQVKEYIGECVESLLAQTYTNLEILLVDDGSTDGSGAICDEYADKDSRVRVLHQENKGLSAARNTGIAHAKGECLAFVDSDDAVLPGFIETLYELLGKYQADIAACAYVKCPTKDFVQVKNNLSRVDGRREKHDGAHGSHETKHKQEDRHCSNKEVWMTSEQMLRQWHGKYKTWETVSWNKLYRRRVFEGKAGDVAVRFPIGRRHEDVLTSHLLAANAARIVMTQRTLYLYRIRPGSITDQRVMVGFWNENLRAQRERMDFFKKKRYWRAYLNLLWGYVLHLGWFGWKRMREHK